MDRRKREPGGPAPASQRHSSTFVRFCQAPFFYSGAGSHGVGLLGASWVPWRVFPRSEGAPRPRLVYLRPAPSCRDRAEPKGDRKKGPALYQPRAPRSPQRGRRGGGAQGRTPRDRSGRTEAPSPQGPGGGDEPGGGQGRTTAQPGAGVPPPPPPGTKPAAGHKPKYGTREARGGDPRG